MKDLAVAGVTDLDSYQAGVEAERARIREGNQAHKPVFLFYPESGALGIDLTLGAADVLVLNEWLVARDAEIEAQVKTHIIKLLEDTRAEHLQWDEVGILTAGFDIALKAVKGEQK